MGLWFIDTGHAAQSAVVCDKQRWHWGGREGVKSPAAGQTIMSGVTASGCVSINCSDGLLDFDMKWSSFRCQAT